MAKSFSPARPKARNTKVNVQHVFIFVVLVVSLFLLFQFKVIPWGASQFVVPLFRPSGDKLDKIGFVKFNGLVWASTTKEKERDLKQAGSVEIKKDLINKEFIFDFTYNERNEAEHGYVKASAEFYAKSEVLGENAIILEPWVGFWILALVFAFFLTVFITMIVPSNVGLLAILIDRQIDNTKTKIRLQTGFSDEVVEILIVPDDVLAQKDKEELIRAFRIVWDRTTTEEMSSLKQALSFDDIFDDNMDVVVFRNESLYGRIKEYFSDFVVTEIEDSKMGLLWRRNHLYFGKGLRLYMAHHFTEKYANNVTGMAYGGAAFLIVAVGIRGLKFIPSARPSFILLAIFLEFTMLTLLAVTLFYTEEEERMDRLLKKMEDANRGQLEALRSQQHDIHQLSSALVGQTADIIKHRVESAITEYMTSDDKVKQVVAEEIGAKIMDGIRQGIIASDKVKEQQRYR